ncbi:MAG: bifunctional UDP-3-O-[3-hydroxymyristoyl] N-acetylglucosamine deacetylase/3-hydroxyacyl-ACP dehydratase [Verrucomicrobiae bacterium]|nr:bifunctional UDP-3-O-[3-hydroxymyristoyl] N-acetylglucosamine deacetylase/3-hydroxyacyl-ACP dehydratase [Verrucomicrobiae bacterium]
MAELQKTLGKTVAIKGLALHTGHAVTLTLQPAAENSGFIFKRMDLKDEPVIHAHVDHVKQVERATTIAEGNVKVHTVEHVLSALRGLDVDNAIIEMDAMEPPIGDGSARPFVEMIQKAGVIEQAASRDYFELKQPLFVRGKDGGVLAALPAKEFEINCTNVTHTKWHTQFCRYLYDTKTYAEEIGGARTFVFYEEVQSLMNKGLIKGGSLENAVVIRDGNILSKEPLRYDNEFARHKVLDIIGDLALFPKRLKAQIIAIRTGHALNVELAKALAKELKMREAQSFPVENIPVGEGALDINEIMRILPHRYPFLLVDRILKFEGDSKVIAIKNVSINEPFFEGHFPGHPIMPGVLQIEALAQVASLLLLRQKGSAGNIGYFMSADKVKFRKPVLPGDTVILQVELLRARKNIGKAWGQCLVNGEIVSEGEMTFAFIDE